LTEYNWLREKSSLQFTYCCKAPCRGGAVQGPGGKRDKNSDSHPAFRLACAWVTVTEQ